MNTSNGRHFAKGILKCIFNENVHILIQISNSNSKWFTQQLNNISRICTYKMETETSPGLFAIELWKIHIDVI